MRARGRIEAEELLGGEGEQVGLVDQSHAIGRMMREMQQRGARERRRRVDPPDRREERDRLSDVFGEPYAVDLVVRDRGERVVAWGCDPVPQLFGDPAQHRSVRLRGFPMFGRPGRIRGDAVEGVREHLPVLTRVAEPIQRDRRRDGTGEIVDELALAALHDLVEVVPGLRRVALLGEARRELAVVEGDRVLLGVDPLG